MSQKSTLSAFEDATLHQTARTMPMVRIQELVYFINERYRILQRRLAGEPSPWTADPILAKYRFTNVFREDDPVTRWIQTNWIAPHVDHHLLLPATVAARLFNNPQTLEALGYPVRGFDMEVWDAILRSRVKAGYRIFNAAYIVSTNGQKMDKIKYVLDLVERVYENCINMPRNSLEQYARELMRIRGIGSFMAGQIIADLKFFEPLSRAEDWDTWATPGPGSRIGLAYAVMGDTRPFHDKEFPIVLRAARNRAMQTGLLVEIQERGLDAQNFQNCLCEFSKYCRTKDGTGVPKQIYTPKPV